MLPVGYLFFGFGAFLALVGIVLFAKMGTQGTSSVKMFGLEFQLGGSALVIFVVGVVLVIVPVLYAEIFFTKPPQERPSEVPAPRGRPATTISKGTPEPPLPSVSKSSPDPSQSQGHATRYIVLDVSEQIEFDKGEFASPFECGKHVTRYLTSPPNVGSCTTVPAHVWCYSEGGTDFTCWIDKNNCDAAAAAMSFRAEQFRCARETFADARKRALAKK